MSELDERVVALLRGINVGGRNKIPMAALRSLAEASGLSRPATHLQSGNLVVAAGEREPAEVADGLQAAIRAELHLDVPVIVRRACEWQAVVGETPFAGEAAADGTKVHVAFLPGPAAPALLAFDADPFAPEAMAVRGSEVHLLLPGGMGRSRLAGALGRVDNTDRATIRNWKTVVAVSRLIDAH